MKTLLSQITASRGELPLFSSCTSFEYPDAEFILYTAEPKMIFEVVDAIDKNNEPRFFRFVEHNNGESDYLVVADTFSDAWFAAHTEQEAADEVESIMDSLEGWYVSEVIDLDSYDE